MPIKTWVPSKNSNLWTSNRTRDVLDLAFTVYKHNPGEPCRVDIRRTWSNGQRASCVIGAVAFTDHKVAKELIEQLVLEMYTKYSIDKQPEARVEFLQSMLQLSIEDVPTAIYGGYCKAYVYYDGTAHYYTPKPGTHTMVTVATPEPKLEAVEFMMDNIQEVETVATAVIELEPVKIITIGGQTINLAWPN
jgi:hypothetical protein